LVFVVRAELCWEEHFKPFFLDNRVILSLYFEKINIWRIQDGMAA
jgi:hypothetical protein